MEPTAFFYLTLAAVTFLVTSLVFGGHNRGHHDHTFADDVGHHGHGLVRGHGGARQRGSQSIGVISFNTVFLFVAGFGIGGYFAAVAKIGAVATLVAGAGVGVVLAAMGYYTLKFLNERQGSSTHRLEDYVGRIGTIEVSILGQGAGKVRCKVGTESTTFLARSLGGDLPQNSLVRITEIVDSVAIVEAIGEDEAPDRPDWRG